jgi:VWFA-related protein
VRTIVLLLAVSISWTADARQQAPFRASALAVRVDVLVTDGRRPVTGLTVSDFELRDNGVAQKIELVDAADIPLNVVLALDASGSTVGTRQADLLAASSAVLDELRPDDRVALTTFSHAVSPRIGLTADRAAIRKSLATLAPTGRTAIMDAAYVALTTTIAEPGRSLVIICTDGSDVSSWLRVDDLLEISKRANAVVYAVTSSDARRTNDLETLSEATGGDLLRVASGADLRGAFRRILEDFRSRYVLAYSPNGVASGGFHQLDVRVPRRGLTVRARPGYIGAEPPR